MSRGNKEEQKWLLGESLNQYDRSLKEELGKVEKRNREQNHKISALINAFDDDYIKKEEENTNISLDYSKEGIVIIDDIKGNTLVNNVKDSNKELVLNGDIDTQGVNVTLEDTVNNGKVDVVLEGNTEVNLSKTKDPIMITHKFDDINSNDGKLQTTVNGVTTVNDSPGKVDVKEIIGDTLVNHVSNGSEELILNGDIDANGYNNITLTEGIDGGKVDVSLEGNTMVNVCEQEEPIAITKSYTVETGNHIALQGEYDGKCRPNIYGNTMVNIAKGKKDYFCEQGKAKETDINLVYNLKAGTTYTLIRTVTDYTHGVFTDAINFYDASFYTDGTNAQDHNCNYTGNGVYVSTYTPKKDVNKIVINIGMNNIDKDNGIYPTITISDYMILEGDYTNKPIPDYFTGMKSSFEDKLVPENLYRFTSREDFYALDNSVVLDGEYIKMTANGNYQNAMLKPLSTIKPSTTYTIVTDVVENTLDSKLVITVNTKDAQLPSAQPTIVNAGKTGIFTQLVTTGNDLSGCVRCLVNFLDIVNTTGSVKYRIMVVEGDYTNYDFTNYDSTKGGKYKVDYKVTGKNLIAFTELGDILIKTGEDIPSSITMRTSYVFLKANHTYYITNSPVEGSEWFGNMRYDKDKNFIGITYENNTTITPKEDMYLKIKRHNPNQLTWNIQIEEGTTATTYEPYKESIKTLYLNTPLLEGDTIEQSGNDIIHVHRYGKVVLDGINYVPAREKIITTSGNYRWTFVIPNIKNSISFSTGLGICDKYPIVTPNDTWNSIEGITQNNSSNKIVLYLDKYKDGSDASNQALIKELSANPITFIYEKETPTQEIISTNDNLLLDSYTNGHLDVDSVVPIDKVKFNGWGTLLKYLYPNQDYIVQFESDNSGKLSYIGMNYKAYYQDEVTKGVNRFIVTTTEEIQSNFFELNGIGFNASKIVVTPKVDNNFGYFKGMKSVGECEDNKIEILSSKNITPSSHIRYTVHGIEFNFGSKTINENVYVHNTSNKGIMVHTNINGKYSRGVMIIKNSKKLIELNEGEVIYCASVNYSDGWSYSDIEKARNSFIITKKENEINKKEILLSEPLRGLPNGVKDKYVIIDGKWYIERNCIFYTFNGSENWYLQNKCTNPYMEIQLQEIKPKQSSIVCDKLPVREDSTDDMIGGERKNICGIQSTNTDKTIRVRVGDLSHTLEGSKIWLANNNVSVILELAQPTYEPIDYNPFEVYTDTTHISNNSTIPCNMVIKNSGYNTISLKENTKYTAYVNNKNNVSLTYKIDNNAIAVNSSNKFTFTTPSTLVDKTIRIASKGNKIENLMIIEGTPQNDPIGYFDSLKSSYECEKVTDVKDENFGKYKVDTRVKGENFESTQTVYLNSPLLKGDKIIWKDNKLQHYHKMNTVIFDGSDDEDWSLQSVKNELSNFRGVTPKNNFRRGICDKLNFSTKMIADETNEGILFAGNEYTPSKIMYIRKFNSQIPTIEKFKQWLQQNPITVVYELETPYYEEISEYPLKFNSIANCSLSTTSNIQVSNISFNIYEETLPYLYNTTKYYITFNSDIAKEIIINLGGSELTYTTKVGFNKIEITTPSNSNNMLTFNGQGVNINNVKVTQQNIDSYFEGMKSVGECEDLEIVSNNKNLWNFEDLYEQYTTNNPNVTRKFTGVLTKISDNEYTIVNTSPDWYSQGIFSTPIYLKNGETLTFSAEARGIVNIAIFKLNHFDEYYIQNNNFNKDTYTKNTINYTATFDGYYVARFWVNLNNTTAYVKNVQVEKNTTSTPYAPHKSNKQTMTHEPLRGLPNGIRDKYVLIDGKWYIERNCDEVVVNDNKTGWSAFWTSGFPVEGTSVFSAVLLSYNSNVTICNKYKNVILESGEIGYITSRGGVGTIGFRVPNTTASTIEQWKEYLKTNEIKLLYALQTPTYEPINYNPFEVYTDTTHISNNSTIPANMVIKNTGYNTILKPNTKYTVVTNTQGSISAKVGSTKVDSTNNVFTIITPSTLTDSVLRLSGKGLTTKDIMLLEGDKTNYIPKYFTGMESAFEQEYDKEKNKYKVNVKVTDGNKENNITFYINEPLRGVGNVKDKVYVKEDKVVVERNCSRATFDGSDDEKYAIWKNDNKKPTQECFVLTNSRVHIPNIAVGSNGFTGLNYTSNNFIKGDVSHVGIIMQYYNNMHFTLPKAILQTQDIAGFRQWLQNNPTTVVYQLATPVYEEVECDLSKLMLENYENSSLILNSNIPPTVDVRYKGEVPIVSATKELSSNVESTTTDINENIIPYMCDMDYRIVELQLKNASTQGLEVNVLGLDSEDVLFNNRKANKIFNPSYEMLKRDILSKRYSTDEYKYRLERYLLANKISNEEYNELEELIDGR